MEQAAVRAAVMGAGGAIRRAADCRASRWDSDFGSWKRQRAARSMARRLGGKRRWWAASLTIAALAVAVVLVIVVAGARFMSPTGLNALMLALLLVATAVQMVAVFGAGFDHPSQRTVLRYLRTAPFRRAMVSGSGLLVNLRRSRFEALRRSLKSPLNALESDRTTLALILLALFLMFVGMQAEALVRSVADVRLDRTMEALDPASPTFRADERSAIDAFERLKALAGRLSLGGMVAWLSLVTLALARGEFIRRRTLRRLDSLSCPDCGYSLHSAPNAIDRARLGGLPSGPVACPECGSPWPLIPPPTTEEVLAEAARRTAGGRLPPRSYL